MHDGGTVRGAVACARVTAFFHRSSVITRVVRVSAIVAFLLVDACLAADPAVEPNAADLVREVRAAEDWLYQIDSLQLCVEGTWSHSPESIALRRAELKRQDPNREPDPRYDASLRPSARDSLEYAIDFANQRLRFVENSPTENHFVEIWDGKQLVSYLKHSDGYEQYTLDSKKESFETILGSLSWPRAQPHSFWWDPQDIERLMPGFGRPRDFRLAGRADYRGVSCYVLEFDPPDAVVRTFQWYVGRDDHRLYGRVEGFIEHWTLDYKEIAPNCWIPMTQGYTIKYHDPNTKEPYVRLQRDARIVDVRINEPLRETLFEMEWKEGVYVSDRRSGKTVVSKYVAIPPSLVGKPLPDVASLGLDPSAEQVAGKRILLCFADLNQRPSRHCIAQLAAAYNQLRDRGVVLLAVDVSEMDKASLSQWKLDQSISFALGKIEKDPAKVRQTWGVRSLPWLILTDSEHVVHAEGFAIDQLNDRMKEIGHEKP